MRKTKNNLLAAVLLLTALPPRVQLGREVVEHACYLLTETALEGEGEVSVISLLSRHLPSRSHGF